MSDTSKPPSSSRPNRLAHEKSPYLLQHAHNPVDWYPWGDEAFALATETDRPIFLSIGYSTCHWCHVMEHESFEDPIVASLMNEAFVNIKVDREERPDIDQMYMTVCQMMTGSGGWPLTIIMTPDRRPFFAATYIPRTGRMGRAGMVDLVPRVQQLWNAERDRLTASADEIVAHLGSSRRSARDRALDAGHVLASGHRQLADRYDPRHGGFGSAPKFPSPHNLIFLLRYAASHDAPEADGMVRHTLAAMRRGGLFDQLGFGFHRYSTDAEWRLPHFEKMLYDQAMHLLAVTEAFARTRDDELVRTANEIMTYIIRDMRTPDGGFCSAEDADSEGEEGRFYVWTLDELREVLGADDATFAARVWSCTDQGNFADEATGRRTGANVLMLGHDLHELPAELGLDEAEFAARYDSVRKQLFDARERRVRPLKDDKVLTDWNGLMSAAAVRAGAVFDRRDWIDVGSDAVEFVASRLRSHDGHLMHRYRDGEVAVPAFLDDVAFLTWARIELYEATFEPRHLSAALDLAESALRDFWDDESGGFHFTSDHHEQLPVRNADAYDGAMPSGNSVMAVCLTRLARLTGRPDLEARAAATVEAFARDLERMPAAHTHLLQAVLLLSGPSTEVVLIGEPDSDDLQTLLATVRRHAPPDAAVMVIPTGEAGAALRAEVPHVANHEEVGGRATAYVCRDFACHAPTTDRDELIRQLALVGSSGDPGPPDR